jgi:hypothetical protein
MQNEIAKELIEEHIATADEIRCMTPEQQTEFLATKFLSFNKRNSLNILLMCKIFFDLKYRPIFKDFLQMIKVKNEEESSQFKKYHVIGKNFDKLVTYTNSDDGPRRRIALCLGQAKCVSNPTADY